MTKNHILRLKMITAKGELQKAMQELEKLTNKLSNRIKITA